MSQPRRRRRRRKTGAGGSAHQPGGKDQAREQAKAQGRRARAQGGGQAGSRRRRRGRRRSQSAPANPSPALSEDIFRAYLPRTEAGAQMLPEDGTRLEDLIGELQSEWGVPQYPQEYRITLKVAEAKEAKTAAQPPAAGVPKREKAPAAPRIGAEADDEQGSRRRRRRRRGRRRTA